MTFGGQIIGVSEVRKYLGCCNATAYDILRYQLVDTFVMNNRYVVEHSKFMEFVNRIIKEKLDIAVLLATAKEKNSPLCLKHIRK